VIDQKHTVRELINNMHYGVTTAELKAPLGLHSAPVVSAVQSSMVPNGMLHSTVRSASCHRLFIPCHQHLTFSWAFHG